MFERFRNNNGATGEPGARTGSVATAERTRTTGDDGVATRDEGVATRDDRLATRDRPVERTAPADTMGTVRARQRDAYGGSNWGAAFFRWLLAGGGGRLLAGLPSPPRPAV